MKFIKFSMLCIAITSLSVHAQDARSIAMGGTGITTGKGVSGALLNPALLMKHKEKGLKGSFRLGANASMHDHANVSSDIYDANDIIRNLDESIRSLEYDFHVVSNTDCYSNNINSASDDSVCATGLKDIRGAASDVQTLFSNIDNKPIDIELDIGLGFSYLGSTLPFAFNIDNSLIASNTLDMHKQDIGYFDSITKHNGSVNDLTVKDIKNSDKITVNSTGKLSIDNTEDYKLQSTSNGFAVLNSEIAVSVAKDVVYKGHTIHAGITPKIVTIAAASIKQDFDDEMGGNELRDEIEKNKVEATRVTLDLGMLYAVPEVKGLNVGAVITNLIPYSVETKSSATQPSYKVNTGIQAKVGVGYEKDFFNIGADLALNPAKKNGVKTQPFGIGAEANFKWVGVRTGLSHDLVYKGSTSYSLGFDLGYIEIGAQTNGKGTAEVSTQIAFDF